MFSPRKIALLVLGLALAGSALPAAEIKVYVRRADAALPQHFAKAKQTYAFVAIAGGAFTDPVPIKYAALQVPDSLRSERQEQLVEVGLVISPQGKVESAAIVASNSRGLEKAALAMARGFGFKPATLDGQSVYSYAVLPVTYKYVDPAALLKKS